MDNKDEYYKYKKYLKRYQSLIAGSKSTQPYPQLYLTPDLTPYLKRWISIENVICKHYNKRFYITRKNFTRDNEMEESCQKTDIDQCKDPCMVYNIKDDDDWHTPKCIYKYQDKCMLYPDCINKINCNDLSDSDCDSHSQMGVVNTYEDDGYLSDFKTKKYGCNRNNQNNLCNDYGNDFQKHRVKNRYKSRQHNETGQLIEEPCVKHYSESQEKYKCVAKSRLKSFEGSELSHSFTGYYGDTFKILDTIPFITKDERYKQLIYAQIIYTTNDDKTKDLYIGFPCGIVIDMNLLWYNKDFQDFMTLIYHKYLLLLKDEYHKAVLCGHSMGCVIALRFAYYLSKIDRGFFDSQCLVIGSGPHCWIPNPSLNLDFDNTFHDLPNIQIYVTGFYEDDSDSDSDSDDKDKTRNLYLDAIVKNRVKINTRIPEIKNIKQYSLYYPMILLDTDNQGFNELKIYQRDKYRVTFDIHSWEDYVSHLSHFVK